MEIEYRNQARAQKKKHWEFKKSEKFTWKTKASFRSPHSWKWPKARYYTSAE